MVKSTGVMVVDAVNSNRLSSKDITLLVRYQTIPNTKQYYLKNITIIQSSDQFITYGR